LDKGWISASQGAESIPECAKYYLDADATDENTVPAQMIDSFQAINAE
jgi:hypothetical protein